MAADAWSPRDRWRSLDVRLHGSYRYALEAGEGFFKTHGIGVGHSIGIREGL
jgi:uncharacterized membrane protein (UPF0127 family)